MRTVLAVLDMTTEHGSAADLDCRHNASLGEVDVAGISRAPRLAMTAEDLRYLELRPDHVGLASGRSRRLNIHEIKRALNLFDHIESSLGGKARFRSVNAS